MDPEQESPANEPQTTEPGADIGTGDTDQPEAQELGRVERPPADQFQGKRRLLLVPLMFAPPVETEGGASDGQAIYDRYWDQVRTQIDALASGLGGLHRIYHESLVEGGQEGLDYLQMAYRDAHSFIQVRFLAGATLEATESIDLITETLDLQRCLMVPFTNDQVAARIQDWLAESTRARYEYIAGQIEQTLQPDETGLLLINERHQVQFPADLEVFYVAPPALDEYRRWIQNWIARQQQPESEPFQDTTTPDPEDAPPP